MPSTADQNNRLILHHTLGNTKFDVFANCFSMCSAATVIIDQFTTGPMIDRCLETCIRRNLPVYIGLPMDLVHQKLSAYPLQTPLELSPPPNDVDTENAALAEIEKVVESAKNPIILCDAGASRDNCGNEVEEFLRTCSNWPFFVSSMGKGSANEQLPNYAGTYLGSFSFDTVRVCVELADVVVSIGRFTSDFNSGFFSSKFPVAKMIDLHATYTVVDQALFSGVGMKRLLPKLSKRFAHYQNQTSLPKMPTKLSYDGLIAPSKSGSLISHNWLWSRMQTWLQEGDILLAEPGTCFFAALDLRLPANSSLLAQYLWCSIGYATGALSGAVLANQSMGAGNKRRVIAFLGDGSFQMAAQELSTLVRQRCSCWIFLVDNRFVLHRIIMMF